MWIVSILVDGPFSLEIALWVFLVIDIMLVIWERCHIVSLVIFMAQFWMCVVMDVVVQIMVDVLMWVNHNWLRMVVCLMIGMRMMSVIIIFTVIIIVIAVMSSMVI